MMNPCNILEHFNHYAQRLTTTKIAEAFGTQVGIKIHLENGNLTVDDNIPYEYMIEEFLMVYRRFFHSPGQANFTALREAYRELPVGPEIQNEVITWCDLVDQYLDSTTLLQLHDAPLTRRDIQNLFIYGFSEQSNSTGQEQFQKWQTPDIPLFEFLKLEFITSVLQIYRIIELLVEVNIQVLRTYSTHNKPKLNA